MSYIIGTNTNVKATITIYKRCILNGEKNFALDNAGSGRSIETYLATLESKVVNNVNNIHRYTVSSYDDTVCTLKMTRYELDEFIVKSYLFGSIRSIKTSNGFDISTDIFA